MTNEQLTNPGTRDEWERAVKKHARRIKGMISHNLFGWNIGDNKDALIVSVYLKGVEEGTKNSKLVLEEILRQRGIESNPETI